MINVLKPLEVRAGNTTTVHKQIRGAHDTLLKKNLLSSVSSRSVGSFEDGLALDVRGVHSVDGLLSGSRHNVVDFSLDEFKRVLNEDLVGLSVSLEASVSSEVVLGMLNIETVLLVDSAIPFNDVSNFTTVLLNELSGPVTNISESLEGE